MQINEVIHSKHIPPVKMKKVLPVSLEAKEKILSVIKNKGLTVDIIHLKISIIKKINSSDSMRI